MAILTLTMAPACPCDLWPQLLAAFGVRRDRTGQTVMRVPPQSRVGRELHLLRTPGESLGMPLCRGRSVSDIPGTGGRIATPLQRDRRRCLPICQAISRTPTTLGAK